MTTNLTAKKSNQKIVITRVFDAPRALVFKAWIDPKHLAQWWGPRGFANPRCELDVRPGGLIRIDMQAPNGTIYPMSGVYLEIVEPERLIYTSGALDAKGVQLFEFLHTVTFAERNGKTTLNMVTRLVKTTAEAAKYIGGFEAGMTQSLEKLATMLVQKSEPFMIVRTFAAPIALVWHAITNQADMAKWYFEMPAFKAEVGFEFEFSVEHNGKTFVHLCRVTEVVAGKKIAYTWRYAGQPGDSLVTFELFDDGGKTRLKLTHEGLETFPPVADFARENFARGWTSIIGDSLKQFVETSPQLSK